MVRARFLEAHGRHRPRCHGRCLYADVESEHSAVVASVGLITVPTLVFLLLMPLESYWMLSVVAVVLLVLSLTYLLLAMYTEPGILQVEPAVAEAGRRRARITHCIINGQRHELSAYRAKMCRQTENCVEEFDHFCPWVGNAVGRRNYRYFIAFVSTVSFLALVVGVSSCIHLSAAQFGDRGDTKGDDNNKPVVSFTWAQVILMILVAYTAIVLCSVCGLMCFHMRLIAINQTTNENIRGTWFTQKNPHDQGAARNCFKFATRPIPRSRVISIIGADGAGDAMRVPTDEEHADDDDDDDDKHSAIELI